MRTVLLFVFSLIPVASVSNAQSQPKLPPYKLSDFADDKPGRCPDRQAALDGITQTFPPHESITVVARLGRGETRQSLNDRRLNNVRAYWTRFLYENGRRDPKTIILKTAEPVEDYGRLEFYVRGYLIYVMKVNRNADLFVGSCYPPDDSYLRWKLRRGRREAVYDPCRVKEDRIFYPCRDRSAVRRRTRK